MLRSLTLSAMTGVLAAGLVGPARSQERPATVAGVVADNQFGGPLPGARVELLGSDVSTLADREGRFRLSIMREGDVSSASATSASSPRPNPSH